MNEAPLTNRIHGHISNRQHPNEAEHFSDYFEDGRSSCNP
jgi:hypothetical protein